MWSRHEGTPFSGVQLQGPTGRWATCSVKLGKPHQVAATHSAFHLIAPVLLFNGVYFCSVLFSPLAPKSDTFLANSSFGLHIFVFSFFGSRMVSFVVVAAVLGGCSHRDPQKDSCVDSDAGTSILTPAKCLWCLGDPELFCGISGHPDLKRHQSSHCCLGK